MSSANSPFSPGLSGLYATRNPESPQPRARKASGSAGNPRKMPQRYYSQHYDPVDNPFSANVDDQPSPGIENPFGNSRRGSSVALEDFHDKAGGRSPPTAYNPLYNDQNSLKQPKGGWSRRRKLIIGGVVVLLIVIIAVVVGVAVSLSSGGKYDYTPSTTQVNNTAAFTNGGATKDAVTDTSDGIGAGKDEYTYYSGEWTNFPNNSDWISFEDMWQGNYYNMQHSCKNLKQGSNNSPKVMADIYSAIQNRAEASLVDHRFILAIILQESHGCVRVGSTTSSTGVKNPGLMQSHNGHAYSSKHSNESIVAMVQDGTQGTSEGDGLAQGLDLVGNAYSAARYYNSGYVPKSGNLSEAAGATACYVSDVANRLTGWANATTKCTES